MTFQRTSRVPVDDTTGAVPVVNPDGSAIGGGTQYTEAATDTTITGTAALWEDSGDTLRAISNTYPLPVQQAALSASVDAVAVSGNVAHDAVDSGNPVKVGGKAASADPTAVAAADRVDALYTTLGKQVVLPYALSASFVSGTTASITDTTTTSVIAAPTAGLKLYITNLVVQNSHATVSTWVIIEEETSGTDLYSIYAPALGGGASVTLPVPLVVPTAAKGLFAVCVTTGAAVRVSASGYKAP